METFQVFVGFGVGIVQVDGVCEVFNGLVEAALVGEEEPPFPVGLRETRIADNGFVEGLEGSGGEPWLGPGRSCFRLFGIDDSYVKQGSGVLWIYFQGLLVFLERGGKMPFPEVAGAEVAEESAVLRGRTFWPSSGPGLRRSGCRARRGRDLGRNRRGHPLS